MNTVIGPQRAVLVTALGILPFVFPGNDALAEGSPFTCDPASAGTCTLTISPCRRRGRRPDCSGARVPGPHGWNRF